MEGNINFSDLIGFAKLFSIVVNGNRNITVDSVEMDAICEMLKKLADQQYIWSQEQKEIYKIMVDYTKDQMKGQK